MLHHRIAARYGILDVDAVANSLTKEQLAEQEAVAVIDGWHHGRQLEASIIAAIHNSVNDMMVFNSSDPEAAAKKLKYKTSFEVLKEITTFEPRAKKKTKTSMSIQAFEKRVSQG